MQHLACIMDGNRRYALKHGWKPWIGHQKGVDAVRIAIDFCLQNNIGYLSLYTFSIENFKRSAQEKSFLFDYLFPTHVKNYKDELIKKGIRVRIMGDRSLFPSSVAPLLDQLEQDTQQGNNLQLNFMFCYGSQQEIVYATREIARKVKSGQLTEDEIDERQIALHLWTHGTPEPDLVIRSGGQNRISNFLLFQSAYSEYYFTDQFWPALTKQDFKQALEAFNARKRNFGQ